MAKKSKSKLPKPPKKTRTPKNSADLREVALGKEKAVVLKGIPLPPRLYGNTLADKFPDDYQKLLDLEVGDCVIFDKSKANLYKSLRTRVEKETEGEYQYRPIGDSRAGIWRMKGKKQKRSKKEAEE